MNITNFIKPLVINRKGIDDDFWIIRVSCTSNAMDTRVRVECKNNFKLITKQSKKKENIFNIILFINRDGAIEFNRITLGKGEINCNEHRVSAKQELYKMFRPSIERMLEA